jgi:hypothetical protein
VQAKGILNEPRYFARISRTTGQPSRRQISLIGQEQIAEHAAALGMASIPTGAVRAKIETAGIDLLACVGQVLQIADAALLVFEPRMPCEIMNANGSRGRSPHRPFSKEAAYAFAPPRGAPESPPAVII